MNGVFSGSSSVPITVFGFNGTVDMTLMQREFGVTVIVSLCCGNVVLFAVVRGKTIKGVEMGSSVTYMTS